MATTQIKDGYNGGSDNQLKVNSDGSINVTSGGGGSSNVNIHDSSGNALDSTSGALNVDVTNFPATQPISGTVSAQIYDSSGNALTSTSGALNVSTTGSSTVSGTVNSNINGLTAFQTSQYTIGTSAVQLTPSPLANRSSLSIKVITTTSADMVYIGNSSSVTTSTGYFLFNGDSIQLDLTPAISLYAVGTSAGQIVGVIELGT